MADQIKKLSAGHSIEVLDAIMTEVEEARGEYESLDARLDEISGEGYSKAEVDALIALKQNALSAAQLAAVNSGIDSEKVAQIETNKNNISIVDISDKITAASGYTINSLTKLYMQGSHVFGHLIVSKNDGNFGGAQETIARFSNGYRPRDVQVQGCFFGTTEYNTQYTGYAYIQLASASSGQGSVIVKGYQTDVGTVANIHVDFIV